jgi:hypothetical protein
MAAHPANPGGCIFAIRSRTLASSGKSSLADAPAALDFM